MAADVYVNDLYVKRSALAPLQVIALGVPKVFGDLAPLSEEPPRFRSAREEERADPERAAQAPRADQTRYADRSPTESERKKASAGKARPRTRGAISRAPRRA
jgi:hypothetical protein